MNLIIPMAGRGSRLRPHTLTVPKPLVHVAGKPIVQRLVEDLAAMTPRPFDHIAFVIGDFGPEVEADLLALAREQAALEVQLQAIAQDAAQQQRRLDTNLLTLSFSSPYERSPLGRIGEAFSRLQDNLAEGTANLIEFIGYSLPFLIVLFPVALGLRKLWRRLTRH